GPHAVRRGHQGKPVRRGRARLHLELVRRRGRVRAGAVALSADAVRRLDLVGDQRLAVPAHGSHGPGDRPHPHGLSPVGAPGRRANVMVSGHSLGGALTTVVAPWLYDQLPRTRQVANVTITPYTFAAPTAGGPAFAAYYDSIFPTSYRCVNTLDIVPMGYENISGLMGMYPKPSQTLWDYSGVL